MSLYRQLFGENENADKILDLIDINRDNFGRYRDCWLSPDGTIATVLSRIGDGNRENYEYIYANLKLHIRYKGYKEDEKDPTYVYFYFEIPDRNLEEAKKIAPKEEHPTVWKMFEDEIKEATANPESPTSKRMEQIVHQIFDQMENGDGTVRFIGI